MDMCTIPDGIIEVAEANGTIVHDTEDDKWSTTAVDPRREPWQPVRGGLGWLWGAVPHEV